MIPLIDDNTCIAALAPSGAYNEAKLQQGLQILTENGFRVEVFERAPSSHRYLAGTDEFRAKQLEEAFTNPKYGAVWAIRGGYGLTRLLPHLPFSAFQSKPLIGFSDVVALQIPLAEMGFPVVHGPVIHSLGQTDSESQAHLFALLRGESTQPMQGEAWTTGSVSAPIVGGNLCMISMACGTPWSLETTGKVLLLEDIGEYVYRIDRSFQHIKNAGLLKDIAGLALGEFNDCNAPEGADYTVYDVMREHIKDLKVPVTAHLPIGHGRQNRAFVWNQTVTMSNGHLHL